MTTYVKRIERRNSGFTLVEIAVVLLIITLLMTGLVPTISSQLEQRQMNETRKQLDDIQQALIGYAIINGRLPCPASPTSNGEERPVGGGNCTDFYNGFVPAATLGIASVPDNQGNTGFAVDAWGNRIRYAVTSWNGATVNNVFTTTDGMRLTGVSSLSPNLLVCASATAAGFNGTTCGANNSLTSAPGVPAVIFSTGKNGGYGGTSADETANLDGTNRTFVSHTPTAGANEFDDLIIWMSPNSLLNRMISAGKLP